MIKSEPTGKRINDTAEVECVIVGSIQDFMSEYEAIMRAISRNHLLLLAADAVTTKLAKQSNVELHDCVRKDPDTIDIINKILKEMKEND